jgi:hypothetical protein
MEIKEKSVNLIRITVTDLLELKNYLSERFEILSEIESVDCDGVKEDRLNIFFSNSNEVINIRIGYILYMNGSEIIGADIPEFKDLGLVLDELL